MHEPSRTGASRPVPGCMLAALLVLVGAIPIAPPMPASATPQGQDEATVPPGQGMATAPQGEEGAPVPQGRPVVGLVLSGGGAHGLAHIGVIEWLEEQRIPIDRVAGTSMGGLIGGLYATGSDHEEMLELIDGIDWPLVLGGDTPYALKSFRRKQDARQAPATFEIGLRDGFSLPPGIDAGHQVGLILDRIAYPYAGLVSFDRLPTPFACVAVDLVSGGAIVYRAGQLREALRATMSYPGWFAPVRADDRVLVDGGVLNNLPTDVMQGMGADVIIAVDVGKVTEDDAPYSSVLGVANRTLSVMMRDNTERNAALADILLAPDVSRFGMMEFDRAADLMRIGYESAAAAASELLQYALDETSWNDYRALRQTRRRVELPRPTFVVVEGAVDADRDAVRAAVEHHLGAPFDPDHLDRDLTEITGWGRYDVVGYAAIRRDGAWGLEIQVQEKTYGPPFLRPILDLQGSEFGEAVITFGGRFTFLDIAGTNSEWRTDATYGQSTLVRSELYVPIGNAGFFVEPFAIAAEQRQVVYDDGEGVAEYEATRAGGGVAAGYLFGPRSELSLGVSLEWRSAETTVGVPLFEALEGAAGSVGVAWQFDGANHPLIPTSGVRLGAAADWTFASPEATGSVVPGAAPDDNFYQAQVDLLVAHRLGRRFSLLASAQGGSSFGAEVSPLQEFMVGGPLRLGALASGELRGSDFFFGRAGVLWAFAEENRLSFFGQFYLAALYEIGDAFDNSVDPFQDVTVGLTGETPIGGVFVGGAVGQDRRAGFFFAVGRLF